MKTHQVAKLLLATRVTLMSLVFTSSSSLRLLSSFIVSSLFVASFSMSVLTVKDVNAHQQKMAITTVYFNARTNNIEVMHRFNLHDAEHAVKEIFDGNADIIQSEATQSDFANYVVERFAIYRADKTELSLSLVGTELEGTHFWVYQETPAPKSLNGMYIQHNALRDIWHTQTNTINIEGMGDIQTLTFTDDTELLSVSFN
jgi:hypothetical protein